MENEQLICPITLDVIKIAGITCVGTIYSYDAIHNWLLNQSTDPLTNLKLPSKFIFKKENLSVQEINDFANKVKQNTKLWSIGFRIISDSPIKYKKLYDLHKNINIPEWIKYNKYKSLLLHNYAPENGMYFKSCYSSSDVDENDEIKRPINTGHRFQFISIENKFIQSKIFKSELFDFAHLKDCIFVNCDFSRASFIGTNFDGTYFRNCRFIGEQLNFYKSTIGNYLQFDKCTFEYLDRWEETDDINEIKIILKDRQLVGNYVVK